MIKMIPHYLISKKFEKDPVIELLSKHGLFNFDESRNVVEIACDKHYIIPKSFRTDPVLVTLAKFDYFDFEAEENTIYLPIDKWQAHCLQKSPFGDPPIESYLSGVARFLRSLRSTEVYRLAEGGDDVALKAVRSEIARVQKAMREALATAKLYAAFPYGDKSSR
jgi:hypothetical protein